MLGLKHKFQQKSIYSGVTDNNSILFQKLKLKHAEHEKTVSYFTKMNEELPSDKLYSKNH
jgi:hypothetical protein